MNIVDLRSDTVTKPTPAMREAMCQAEVGDDVFAEDPTINRLEQMASEMLGKEAALFVASGTMGNLVALLTHCGRGDEVILGDRCHIYICEQGGMAALGGITPRAIPNQLDGTLRSEHLAGAIRGDDIHFPRSRLVCLENTHNDCNGSPLTENFTELIVELAHSKGLLIHMDGARIFNAAVALAVDVKRLVSEVDSVMFCLSKGLGAPVGSLLCGSDDFIERARRTRKVVGGGMRQAGIIAAAGIVALEQMVDRLAEDHVRAKHLAEGLMQIPGVRVAPVETNIVYFWLTEEVLLTHDDAVNELAKHGVLLLGNGRLRAVTHHWIDEEDIERVLKAMRKVCPMSG
jgi:threonine aldolase